jgi:uncharacterized protein YdgA (DUF945 family)
LSQNKVTVAAAAVAAVIAVGYPAASWYLGKQIEATHAEIDAKIAAIPYLKLVRHDYQRGLFSADETITIEIPSSLFRMPTPQEPPADPSAAQPEARPDAPPAAPLPPFRLTMRTAIQHGPLPGFKTFGAGSASTVIEFDEAIQKKIAEAFGGKPALDIQTFYNFQGGGHGTLKSPPFKIIIPSEGKASQAIFSGDGLEMNVEFTRHMQQYSMRGSAPRFELIEPSGPRIAMTGLRMESSQQRMFEDDPLLYSGSQQITLAEISVDPGQEGGPKIGLKEIKYDVQVPAAGEFVDVIARMGATTVQVGEQNYGPANYDFSLKHLHARKLMAINRSLMALYTKPELLQDQGQLLQAMAPMKDQLVALLLDNPVLSLDRLSFRMPEGEASVSASVKLVDVKAEDFANPLLLPAKIDASADIAFPSKLVLTLSGGKAQNEEEATMLGQMAQHSIDNVVQHGYATLDGGILKSRITFKTGQLLVNDKPFNPMALMAPPPQQAEQPVEPAPAQ